MIVMSTSVLSKTQHSSLDDLAVGPRIQKISISKSDDDKKITHPLVSVKVWSQVLHWHPGSEGSGSSGKKLGKEAITCWEGIGIVLPG